MAVLKKNSTLARGLAGRVLPGGALLLARLAGCNTLDEQQRRWIFQPGTRTWAGTAAADSREGGMQDVWIDFRSTALQQPVRLHGLWLPQPLPGAPVMLYLHGARWDVPSSAHRMRRMHKSPGRFVLLEGGSHHDTNAMGQAQYRQALAEPFGPPAAGP